MEVVRRTGEHGSYLFVINHTGAEAKVPVGASGTELIAGERFAGVLAVPPGAVRVVRADG